MRYELLKVLGEGEEGVVHKAQGRSSTASRLWLKNLWTLNFLETSLRHRLALEPLGIGAAGLCARVWRRRIVAELPPQQA